MEMEPTQQAEGQKAVQQTQLNGPASVDLDKIRQDQFELREKLLSLRENELFQLRQQVSGLDTRFKLAFVVGGILLSVLGAFGFKQFADLNELINRSMQKKIDESLGYYDQVSKAMLATNNQGCSQAEPLLKDLANKRPDDEVVFGYLTFCFNDMEEYDIGYIYLSDLKARGLFPRKFETLTSYNNVGFMVMSKSFREASFENEARDLLRKAEKIAIVTDSNDLCLPLANLALLALSRNELEEATAYAKRSLEIEGCKQNWSGDTRKEWFKALEKKRPSTRKDLEALFPDSLTRSTPPTDSK